MNASQLLSRRLLVVIAALIFALSAVALIGPLNIDQRLVPGASTPQIELDHLSSLTTKQRDELIQREKAHLLLEPLDFNTLNNLAILEIMNGEPTLGNKLLLEAAKRSLHDPGAQFAAMLDGLTKSDYPTAFGHMDAMLTAAPSMDDQVFPLIVPHLARQGAAEALAATLLRDPTWRVHLMAYLRRTDHEAGTTYSILKAMAKIGVPRTTDDLRNLLEDLFASGKQDRAYYIWLDSLDDSQLAKVLDIYDGKFSLTPNNMLFDWNIRELPNERITVAGLDVNNRQLRLEFSKSNAAFGTVFQYLRLGPGSYTLTGHVMAKNFHTGEGLVWRLTCVEGRNMIFESQRFKTDMSPMQFDMTFQVPGENCQTQKLDLVSASALALDVPLDGEISFWDLAIKPSEAAAQ